jgi:hypothetical protein
MEKNRTTQIVVGLVMAHAVLHLAALRVVVGGLLSPSGMVVSAAYMLAPSQGALLAVWAVFSRDKLAWRVLSLTLVGVAYLPLFLSITSKYGREWVWLMIEEALTFGAVLLMARLTGLQLARVGDSRRFMDRFQFYIRDMLIWTTALAVFLSAWRCTSKNILIDLISLTLVAGVSTFSTLGRGWIVARIVRVPAIIGLATVLAMTVASEASWWDITLPLSLMALWIVASLLVLRSAGYRLVWRPRIEEPLENAAS